MHESLPAWRHVPRLLQSSLIDAARGYPVVTLLGPRQSGKTTLARETFPDKAYVSLENPDTLARARLDPRAFLAEFDDGVVLDEVQRMPELLSWVQGLVDERQRPGEYVLTGSVQNAPKSGIGQSLAGRTAIFRLLPLSLEELGDAARPFDLWSEIHAGGFPRLRQHGLAPSLFHNSYLQIFLERDLVTLLQVRDLNQFRDFVRLLAGRVGQLVNHTSLGNDIGASPNTVRQWLSVLEAANLVFQLTPYYENFGKRIVKSPKVFFTDTGLACALLGIETVEQLRRDPLGGGLVENWAILEVLKGRWHRGREANLHFFRDSNGAEVDLLIGQGSTLLPVEIKSSRTFSAHFLKGLARFADLAGVRARDGVVVFDGEDRGTVRGVRLIGFDEIGSLV